MSTYTLFNGYIGAKARYTNKIKGLFDHRCTQYSEPFSGGASIFFSMPYGKYKAEILNERNPNIANLYDLLADKGSCDKVVEGILAIKKPDEEVARKQFAEARKKMFPKGVRWDRVKEMNLDDRIKTAISTYLVFSQSYHCNGVNFSRLKNNEKYCNETRRNLLNAVERFQGSQNLRIEGLDGIEMIKCVGDREQMQLYVDPPYVGMYRSCSKLYFNEMAELKNHIALATELAKCKCAVVLSGYRSQIDGVPTVYDAYLGEEWRCFKLAETYNNCAIVRKGQRRKRVQEYVWTNRVPDEAGRYFLMDDYKEKMSVDEYWNRIRIAIRKGVLDQNNALELEYETTYRELYGTVLIESHV